MSRVQLGFKVWVDIDEWEKCRGKVSEDESRKRYGESETLPFHVKSRDKGIIGSFAGLKSGPNVEEGQQTVRFYYKNLCNSYIYLMRYISRPPRPCHVWEKESQESFPSSTKYDDGK